MSVLVVYSTVEGQSAKIADFAASIARNAGNDVTVLDAADMNSPQDFDGVEKIILIASVHERRHSKPFEVFLSGCRNEIEKLTTLMLSVSLSAAFPAGMEDAQDYLDEMKLRTGLRPNAEMLVAGAVRHLSYDYYEREVLQHIVLRKRDYDMSEGDREFTDWEAVRRKVSDFLKM